MCKGKGLDDNTPMEDIPELLADDEEANQDCLQYHDYYKKYLE